MAGKIIILSAPSGSGKTTIVQQLLNMPGLLLEFSVSACSRPKRSNETHGKDYYFLSVPEFKEKIKNQEFLEWEEVYKNHFYGSLISEVDRITNVGRNIIFDVDVKGALNIKKHYGQQALSIYIKPPSIKELEKRLIKRATDSPEEIKIRLEKAEFEMGFADKFDEVIVNDVLENSVNKACKIISDFLKR